MKLKSTNAKTSRLRIVSAFFKSPAAREHGITRNRRSGISTHFEHGQWWVMCVCGAAWSVVDSEGGPTVDGFDFEQVSEGDGHDD